MGSDRQNEEVRLHNPGTEAVSLVGWRIGDSSGTSFWNLTATDGSVGPGETARIIRRRRRMALNNTGDTVSLVNPAGDIVDQRSYDGPVASGQVIELD